MELNEYQKRAMSTCMESSNNFAYMSYGLAGEVGEFMGKIGKYIRKGKVKIDNNDLIVCNTETDFLLSKDEADALIAEIGDCLWFVSGLCTTLGWSLEEIGQKNLDKLAARKAAGTIDGNGDGIIR